MFAKKNITVALALLISGNTFGAALSSAWNDYQVVKRNFNNNPAAYFDAINTALDNVRTAINPLQANKRQYNTQMDKVAAEQDWINSRMPMPTRAPASEAGSSGSAAGLPAPAGGSAGQQAPLAPAGGARQQAGAAAGAQQIPILGLGGSMPGARPNTRLKDQVDQINKLIEDFDSAIATHDLDQMFDRYSEMLVVIPTLDLIGENDRQGVLKQAQTALEEEAIRINRRPQAIQAMQLLEDFDRAAAINDLPTMQRIYNDMARIFPTLNLLRQNTRDEYLKQAAIDMLFAYIATKRDTTARKAESALIRILSNAQANAAIREEQNTLIGLITNYSAKGNTQAGLVEAYTALQDMMTGADRARTTPITGADRAIRAF